MAHSVGILGGTFDPVHNGHLRLAIECREQLGLDEIRLIPVGNHSFNKPVHADASHRLNMLELAVTDIDGLFVDDQELRREGTSYTIDTLKSLRKELDDTRIVFICGMDVFSTLNSWHTWTEIIHYVHIIIANRPGIAVTIKDPELLKYYESNRCHSGKEMFETPSGKILMIETPIIEISSTHIRNQFAHKRDTRYLLPQAVIDYINEGSLYQ